MWAALVSQSCGTSALQIPTPPSLGRKGAHEVNAVPWGGHHFAWHTASGVQFFVSGSGLRGPRWAVASVALGRASGVQFGQSRGSHPKQENNIVTFKRNHGIETRSTCLGNASWLNSRVPAHKGQALIFGDNTISLARTLRGRANPLSWRATKRPACNRRPTDDQTRAPCYGAIGGR